jgi:hypothetical protein
MNDANKPEGRFIHSIDFDSAKPRVVVSEANRPCALPGCGDLRGNIEHKCWSNVPHPPKEFCHPFVPPVEEPKRFDPLAEIELTQAEADELEALRSRPSPLEGKALKRIQLEPKPSHDEEETLSELDRFREQMRIQAEYYAENDRLRADLSRAQAVIAQVQGACDIHKQCENYDCDVIIDVLAILDGAEK